MKSTKFERYFKDRYLDQVQWYDKKSLQNQRVYKILKCIIIALSFSVPVTIALTFDSSRLVSIVLSSIAAILTAIAGAFKFYENWINYRTTCESLKTERHYYDFALGPYKDCNDREALFVERVESLISKEHTGWRAIRKGGKQPIGGE